jgi:TatD DNase family protein
MAKEVIGLGFTISFAGPLTYRNANKLLEVATKAPADAILIETDAPYLSPEPYRGKQNEPARVRLVAERLAELRGLSLEEIAQITTANACRVFGIPMI